MSLACDKIPKSDGRERNEGEVEAVQVAPVLCEDENDGGQAQEDDGAGDEVEEPVPGRGQQSLPLAARALLLGLAEALDLKKQEETFFSKIPILLDCVQ